MLRRKQDTVRKNVSTAADSTKIIDYAISALEKITTGDFSEPIDVSFNNDTTGLLAAVEKMRMHCADLIGDIRLNSRLISGATKTSTETARELRDSAIQVQKITEQTEHSFSEVHVNLTTVSAASEELSTNMQVISQAAQRSDEILRTIATNTKELNSASSEIARSTQKASEVSREALKNSENTMGLVSEMGRATQEINDVVAAIAEISDKTKLLALNATIEAARAGEAGKGFAVVAKEVKDLAQQTQSSTRDINGKIKIIHGVTGKVVDAIQQLNATMQEVNEATGTIAAAAEEQSVTTEQIAENIADSTDKIMEMNNSVSEGALAVQDVNRSIHDVTQLSNEAAAAMREVFENSITMRNNSVATYAVALKVAEQSEEVEEQINRATLPPQIVDKAMRAESVFCRFTGKFDVSVRQFNDDHGKIFNYINRLHRSIETKEHIANLVPILKELAKFTVGHFQREEEQMKRFNYSSYGSHKSIHEKLLAKVTETVGSIENGEEVDLIAVLVFLKDWLKDHILQVDKKYSQFLNENGVV